MKAGEKKMLVKVLILLVFFAVMIGIGLYCRKHATDVKGFVLGGRSVCLHGLQLSHMEHLTSRQ